MAVELFTDGIEPEGDAVIWRFLHLWKFRDLIGNRRLYFRRSDLLPDGSEGLPPEEYRHILNLNPLDIRDRRELDHSIGSLAQFRESFFINCWHLFREETCEMWKDYGADGVAICSRYSLLKAALENCDGRPHLGLVRYGSAHLTGWNVQRFISTKRKVYAHEREVRAALWIMDPFAGMNRHFDAENRPHDRPLTKPPADRVLDGVTRAIDVQALVAEIVLSPWVSPDTTATVKRLVEDAACSMPVRSSALARYRAFLPYAPPETLGGDATI
jgi:hypothetical protein